MGTAFTTRERTRFTAATCNPCLIRICAKRSFLLYGAIASQRALPSQQWALPLARTTPRTASSSTRMSSSAASRCLAYTTCGTLWTACTTTIFISTIPSIISRTPANPGSTSKSLLVTFTSRRERVLGKIAGLRTAYQKFSPARGYAIRWTTGARRAAMTGRTGSTRCENIFPSYSEFCFRGDGRKASGQAEVSELVVAFFDHLVIVNPHIALASKHIDVRLGFPVSVGLAAVRISERNMNAGEFFILKQNADHLG